MQRYNQIQRKTNIIDFAAYESNGTAALNRAITSEREKKFWCVTTIFYKDGRVESIISDTIRAFERPENSCRKLKTKEIQTEWFGSQYEAIQYKNNPVHIGKTESAIRNAQKNMALVMDAPFVVFLTIMAIATVFVCVNFLKLQSDGINYRNHIASLESQVLEARMANDNAYENAVSSVDMNEVKQIAVNQLNMHYPKEGEVITYSVNNTDYVRQYAEIPKDIPKQKE